MRAAAFLTALLLAAGGRAAPLLVDATAGSGLSFRHAAAHSPAHLYPETFGGGVALLDLEGDGDLDVLFVDSGSPPGAAAAVPARHRLFRNLSAGPGAPLRFEELAAPALAGFTGMGACVGDVDGDGDPDVWLTGLPAGRLLRNEAGRLVEAPADSGASDPGWSTSCVLFDADDDGHLDLFATHYVRWSAAIEATCGGEVEGFVSYCPPDAYEPEADRLLLGDGAGGFRDATREAGLGGRGRGLGVVAGDLDGDGRAELYVANDGTANALWVRNETGSWRDRGLLSGAALDESGRAQAGMGVDAGDVDGDGRLDLIVTNLDLETNNLYLGVGGSAGRPRLRDGVHSAGLGPATLRPLGFGAVLADLDLDGDLDGFVANGHIIPEIARIRPDQSWAMEDQFLENRGGTPVPRFVDARAAWLPAAGEARVSRGLAVGDLDSDGDLDLIVIANGGEARLLRNEAAGPGARWLGLSLSATRGAPGAPGALARLRAGRERLAVRRTGGSYLSASDPRLHFGLGDAPPGRTAHLVDVSWPGRGRERFGPLAEGRYHELVEGEGAVCEKGSDPFSAAEKGSDPLAP